MMKLACCVWAITRPDIETLRQMKDIGFEWIDIQPTMLKTEELQTVASDLGLAVSCVGLSFGLADGVVLSHGDADKRQMAIQHMVDGIVHASKLGADTVYVVPDMDASPEALERYRESLKMVADKAQAHQIKLAIEHFPGRALATARDTLSFIQALNHPNVYLLLDSGHLQMSNEDFGETVQKAGERLAYVHLDDNDGEGDLHWSLCDGVMTSETLKGLFDSLKESDYSGAISLELSPQLEDPVTALIQSRDLVLKLYSD